MNFKQNDSLQLPVRVHTKWVENILYNFNILEEQEMYDCTIYFTIIDALI